MKTAPDPLHADQAAILASVATLLKPIARLCVAKAVAIQPVEELLRHAFVEAARNVCEWPQQRAASRISTTTGLTRRQVTRLLQSEAAPTRTAKSHASELLTRWISAEEFTDAGRRPRPLPRSGERGSFDSLAASVTRDVHPRSMLAELQRLGLVEVSADDQTISLATNAFVPRTDWPRMVGFLEENVGDHLRAAVTNVLNTGSEHFEQSLLADELSVESLARVRQLISEQWHHLITALGPKLEALMASDREAGRPQDQSVRIGFYSWTQKMPGVPSTTQLSCRIPEATKQKSE